MKLNKILGAAAICLALFSTSCRSDEPVKPIEGNNYQNGILIANEGNFGTPSAEISYVSADLSRVENNIFGKNNGQATLGDVLQDIYMDGELAYMVLNNSNKIVLTNRNNLKKTGEITQEINQPRYLVTTGNYIYVTNDAYQGAKYLSIYNKADKNFVKKIDFGNDSAERVVAVAGKAFVQHASYGFGNKISIVNTATNILENTVTVPNGQIQETASYNGFVYTLTSTATDSYIYQMDSSGTFTKTYSLPGIVNVRNLEIENNRFYFTSANKVYDLPVNGNSLQPTLLFSVNDNAASTLYGFDVIDGKIFTSDANGFTADSKITVFSPSGAVLKSFTAGKNTNGFYKN